MIDFYKVYNIYDLSGVKNSPEPIVVTACDPVYFWEHAPALIMSAYETHTPLHVHVINPGPDILSALEKLKIWYPDFYHSHQITDMACFTSEQKKVYYASVRFEVAQGYLQSFQAEGVFVMDADAIINKHVPWDLFEQPFAVYDRRNDGLGSNPREQLGMKVLAKAYFGRGTESMLGDINRYCRNNNYDHWFLDQEAIYKVWMDLYPNMPFLDLKPLKIIDWNFEQDSIFWSAKGDRKYTNRVYMFRAEQLKNQFQQIISGG